MVSRSTPCTFTPCMQPENPCLNQKFVENYSSVHLKWPRVRSSTRTPLSAEPMITLVLVFVSNLKIKIPLYLVLCIELMISAVHL